MVGPPLGQLHTNNGNKRESAFSASAFTSEDSANGNFEISVCGWLNPWM